jgi:hypothetical protein
MSSSARLLRALPVELQASFTSLVKKNTQGLVDAAEILFYLQDQNDAEFTYLAEIGKKGEKKMRPMRYVFGWETKE